METNNSPLLYAPLSERCFFILHSPLITVVIVDDHQVVVDGFERIINDSKNMRVIGKAYNVAGCRKLLEAVLPDVILLDVSMPDGDGIDLCAKIKEKYPQVKTLILTSYSELFTINRALDAGADGYVLKSSMSEEVLEGIETVVSGKRFLCDEVDVTLRRTEHHKLELTRREKELLQLIAEGYTLSEQVDRMCLGQNTIRNYRQKLNIKLNAHNTAQLIQNAKALKLV